MTASDDLWIWNEPAGPLRRLSFEDSGDAWGTWVPDGDRIVYTSFRGNSIEIYARAADGTGTPTQLTDRTGTLAVHAITPDSSRVIAAGPRRVGGSVDIVSIPFDDTEPLLPLVDSKDALEVSADLSPDGSWLAFQSNDSGDYEIYVVPFPDTGGGRWQVSTDGGEFPAWSPDGRELFYMQRSQLMTVPVDTKGGFRPGAPSLLFDASRFVTWEQFARPYDVAPDGRFLMMIENPAAEVSAPSIHVVLNWFEELERREPRD